MKAIVSKLNPIKFLSKITATQIDGMLSASVQMLVAYGAFRGLEMLYHSQTYYHLAKYTLFIILMFIAFIYLDKVR